MGRKLNAHTILGPKSKAHNIGPALNICFFIFPSPPPLFAGGATMSSSSEPPADISLLLSQPDCLLLAIDAHLGQHRNLTTASTTTSNHDKIEVTLHPARPPLPTKLYVHCPDLPLTDPPLVIRVVEDLFLLRVVVGCPRDGASSLDDSDYFVYRAGNGRQPTLQRLLRPHPFFHDDDVGLLSRRGGNYTVAVLEPTEFGSPVYDLHVFHSENPTEWVFRKVSVTEPQRRPPLVIPSNCGRLLYHETSTVISIGGEAGTMGWVDLWYGILLCDVLRDEPTLREVPLPLPLDLVSCDNGLGAELGNPIPFRSIAFVKGGAGGGADCLRLVHMEAKASLLVPVNGPAGDHSYKMHDWTILTYTNTAMTSSWKDWRKDCRIQASDITIDTNIKAELLQSGLLGSAPGQALHNLLVSHPAPDISAAADHQGIVYLMARKKYQHTKETEGWMLALDTTNKTLLGAAEFGVDWRLCATHKYWPTGIAKYIKLSAGDKRRMLRAGIFQPSNSSSGTQGCNKQPNRSICVPLA